jgi:hypothetical protein
VNAAIEESKEWGADRSGSELLARSWGRLDADGPLCLHAGRFTLGLVDLTSTTAARSTSSRRRATPP